MNTGQRSRPARGLAIAAALAAGCAGSPGPPVALPTPEERRSAEAAGYELPPIRAARDLVAPELLSGPDYTVADSVYTEGYSHVYTIRSDYGTFHARGDDMLRVRLREIDALAALDEMSATAEFGSAAAIALTSPFVATWNLITHPVDSIVGIPKGAWEVVSRTSELARGERGELEDSSFVEFIGFETKKRQIAAELGVDPYSSNKLLQKQLNRFAWAAYAGGLPSMFVPFSKPRSDAGEEPGPLSEETRLEAILRDYSPEELDRLNRIELAVMGVPEPLSNEFIHHPWYSPRHETVLVENLAALELTQNRRAFIEAAVTATSEEDARFYQRNAELMRRYNDHVARIDQIAAQGGVVTGYTANGVRVVPFAADYAVWSPPTARFARSLADSPPPAVDAQQTELLLSGTLSPLARAEIEGLGIEVVDRALERMPAGAVEAGGDGE